MSGDDDEIWMDKDVPGNAYSFDSSPMTTPESNEVDLQQCIEQMDLLKGDPTSNFELIDHNRMEMDCAPQNTTNTSSVEGPSPNTTNSETMPGSFLDTTDTASETSSGSLLGTTSTDPEVSPSPPASRQSPTPPCGKLPDTVRDMDPNLGAEEKLRIVKDAAWKCENPVAWYRGERRIEHAAVCESCREYLRTRHHVGCNRDRKFHMLGTPGRRPQTTNLSTGEGNNGGRLPVVGENHEFPIQVLSHDHRRLGSDGAAVGALVVEPTAPGRENLYIRTSAGVDFTVTVMSPADAAAQPTAVQHPVPTPCPTVTPVVSASVSVPVARPVARPAAGQAVLITAAARDGAVFRLVILGVENGVQPGVRQQGGGGASGTPGGDESGGDAHGTQGGNESGGGVSNLPSGRGKGGNGSRKRKMSEDSNNVEETGGWSAARWVAAALSAALVLLLLYYLFAHTGFACFVASSLSVERPGTCPVPVPIRAPGICSEETERGFKDDLVKGHYAKIDSDASKIIDLHKDCEPAFYYRGVAKMRFALGRRLEDHAPNMTLFREASLDLAAAFVLDRRISTLNEIGIANLNLKNLRASLALLEIAVAVRPDGDPSAHSYFRNRGRVKMELGDLEGAHDDLSTADGLSGQRSRPEWLRLHFLRGDRTKAEAEWRAAEKVLKEGGELKAEDVRRMQLVVRLAEDLILTPGHWGLPVMAANITKLNE